MQPTDIERASVGCESRGLPACAPYTFGSCARLPTSTIPEPITVASSIRKSPSTPYGRQEENPQVEKGKHTASISAYRRLSGEGADAVRMTIENAIPKKEMANPLPLSGDRKHIVDLDVSLP